MNNRLVVLNSPAYMDAFHTSRRSNCSKAALFHPIINPYQWKAGMFYFSHTGLPVPLDELFEHIAHPVFNRSVEEEPLLYGLFSYLYQNHDLRNTFKFEVSIKKLTTYLDLEYEEIQLRLYTLRNVYGVIKGIGVFPVIQLNDRGDVCQIESLYMHHLLNAVLRDRADEQPYYTDEVASAVIASTNRLTALFILEWVRLYGNRPMENLLGIEFRRRILALRQVQAIQFPSRSARMASIRLALVQAREWLKG